MLEKNSFSNILAMNICVVFDLIVPIWHHPGQPGRFRRNRAGKYLDGCGKNEKRNKKVRKKGRDINYADRRSMLHTEELKIVRLLL